MYSLNAVLLKAIFCLFTEVIWLMQVKLTEEKSIMLGVSCIISLIVD